MQKQIEEMANDLAKICPDLVENCCGQINCVTHLTLSLSKMGYRKASEIFEELEKTLNRKIARSKPQFEKLHRDEKDLSIWGYKDMGYFQGIISTCEDIRDLITELKKKYAEATESEE